MTVKEMSVEITEAETEQGDLEVETEEEAKVVEEMVHR